MDKEGPFLETLTRRLAECPADFLSAAGEVNVAAVVHDLMLDLGGEPLPDKDARSFQGDIQKMTPPERNRLQLVLIASWLLHDDWFRKQGNYAAPALNFLNDEIAALAELIQAQKFALDSDRREELVRISLNSLGLRPAGETIEQATDRLNTLDSVERQRVIRESRAAEQRARSIREAMARKAAEEAAASYGRE
jgi:hypothetical protein